MQLYLGRDPKATSDTWTDFNAANVGGIERVDDALDYIEYMYAGRPVFISKFSLLDFKDVFIPYPREWA